MCQQIRYPLETQSTKIVDHVGRQPQRRNRKRLDPFGAFTFGNNQTRPCHKARQCVCSTSCVRHRRARCYADSFQARDHVGQHGVLATVEMGGPCRIDDEAVRTVDRDDR